MREIPAAVRAKALDIGASAWLDDLPALIEGCARDWGLRLGDPFPDATEAYVVSTTRLDGTPAVLKLLIPRPASAAAHEIEFLHLAAGRGCSRLLEHDATRGALLLERLGPAMADLNLPQPERLVLLAALATAVRRISFPFTQSASFPAADFPPGVFPTAVFPTAVFPTAVDRAERFIRYIGAKWNELGEPCSEAAMKQALAAAESRRRAWDPGRAGLAHGDIHQWNALRTTTGSFKLVDPDGLVAEPECDLGVLMREDPVELLAGDPWDRCRRLADRSGTDAQAIWEWGLADRVATGLTLTVAGVQPVAAQMLAAADAIARSS
ncbi:aminoglycoside phosphotransferase family protein [Actinoplanes sp. CA-030573]|uniref:aminoglycoside phosphotransferase family protein n=1 Tax=Actinoplanes sp. CA-030573 TaxID=3239898 RepID=UPI003D948AE7